MSCPPTNCRRNDPAALLRGGLQQWPGEGGRNRQRREHMRASGSRNRLAPFAERSFGGVLIPPLFIAFVDDTAAKVADDLVRQGEHSRPVDRVPARTIEQRQTKSHVDVENIFRESRLLALADLEPIVGRVAAYGVVIVQKHLVGREIFVLAAIGVFPPQIPRPARALVVASQTQDLKRAADKHRDDRLALTF